MKAYQLSVFAENKTGRLAKVTQILSKEKINIRAITISTSGDSGLINFIVDHPKQGQKVLAKAGFTVTLKPIISVLIKDKPGSLNELVNLLADKNINIENAYGFVLESWKQAVFIIDVDQLEKTEELLEKAGFETVNADVISAIEPFHYMKY
jgi:hypothetical protein